MKKIMDKINSKSVALILAPAATLGASSAFAGDLTAAVTAATTKIGEASADAVTMLAAMMGVGAVIWVGFKLVRLLGR